MTNSELPNNDPLPKRIKPLVFFPPFLLLLVVVTLSFLSDKEFPKYTACARQWVLDTFGWLFIVGAFAMLALCAGLYCSSFGRVIIGGPDSKPLLSRWRWFAIALCAGIGIGIVTFGAAEPIIHLGSPPDSLQIEPKTPGAAIFAMSKAYLHWSYVPYAMYAVPALMFAFAYYNMKKPFSLGSCLWPIAGKRSNGVMGHLVDAICLFSLVVGMSCSMGWGMKLLSGGLHNIFGVENNPRLWAIVGAVIVFTFTISAVTGLHRGIRRLSNINTLLFIGLMIFIFIFGPTCFILSFGVESFGHYLQGFFENTLFTGAAADDNWANQWTIMYWAVWISWTPIIAVFLGRISYGYSVREFMIFNLTLPATFGVIWFAVFGGTAIHMQLYQGKDLVGVCQSAGTESVIYSMMSYFPLARILIPAFVFTAFLSFVTCADSATTAMAGISSTGISPGSPEPGIFIKVVWGTLTGVVAWIVISKGSYEGIREISSVGGLPAMLLCLMCGVALIKVALNPKKYDEFKDGYDKHGRLKYRPNDP